MNSRELSTVHQSSTVPYRISNGKVEFCLITSRKKHSWGFPKGTIESGETSTEAALRETHEEAGLHGRISGDPLGLYEYKKKSRLLTVEVWLMQVTQTDEHWKEESQRKRCWTDFESAKALLLDRRRLAELIAIASGRISSSTK